MPSRLWPAEFRRKLRLWAVHHPAVRFHYCCCELPDYATGFDVVGRYLSRRQQAADDLADGRPLGRIDDTGMRYPARSYSEKIAILCEGHPSCLQGERQLSFIAPATHPCFSDRYHVNTSTPQAAYDCTPDVLVYIVLDTTQSSAPQDVWRAWMASCHAALSRMRHPR